jgi:eukaryotic-like serine/threonine-protein kinase
MIEINEEDCPKSIIDFIKSNKDIEVYEHIKRGANGEVFFGRRNKMGDDVVLKFYWTLEPGYDATEEAVILRSIDHPNILRIFDLRSLPPNYAYFLTPKISGGDLQGIIDSQPLSTHKALKIMSGILIGLTELHSAHNLVHRDMKPGNILIDLPDDRPIIADLGAVKKIESENDSVTASKSTFLYLPPESIKENKYYYRSDIYQVGIIMFQMLGGFFPINDPHKWFSEREMKKYNSIRNGREKAKYIDECIGKKITHDKLVIMKSLPIYIDRKFKRVINKAIHLDYRQRYKNPSLFLKEIHNLLRSTPDYLFEKNILHITHSNGKSFRIYKNVKNNLILEKKCNTTWRQDHSHTGSWESALAKASCKA